MIIIRLFFGKIKIYNLIIFTGLPWQSSLCIPHYRILLFAQLFLQYISSAFKSFSLPLPFTVKTILSFAIISTWPYQKAELTLNLQCSSQPSQHSSDVSSFALGSLRHIFGQKKLLLNLYSYDITYPFSSIKTYALASQIYKLTHLAMLAGCTTPRQRIFIQAICIPYFNHRF